jgi:hypothetical protein
MDDIHFKRGALELRYANALCRVPMAPATIAARACDVSKTSANLIIIPKQIRLHEAPSWRGPRGNGTPPRGLAC